MKKRLLPTLVAILSVFSLTAANQNIANLITSSDWSTIFPNRAQSGHIQGATDDFYSYARFASAVDKISEYSVTFSPGPGGQGTSVAVTKTNGSAWTYVITSSSWAGADYTVDYSTFCNTGNDYNDKRELSAFLANITKETTGGWGTAVGDGSPGDHGKWGLHWLRELGAGGNGALKSTNCYTTGSTIDYQPAAGKCYYGRGPIQISYFYNYGNFSEFLYNNESLVANPDLLEQDGELSLLSAIWFWMTPQCPKPSAHQVMQEIYDESATTYSSAKMSKKGFLHTVNIINGDVECRGANAKPLLRSELYKYYMSLVGFTSTEIANEDMGEYSTLCNSGGTMVKYTSCDFQNVVVNNCSGPALGIDVELSGGSTVLDASVTLKTGESIAWYKDGVLISGAAGTTYTASAVGTYKALVTGTGCVKEDLIIVSAEVFVCSEPALGKDKELIAGSTILNANITLQSGETIAWYKDGVLISGATSTTYTAIEKGTYKAVTTRPGCTKEDEIIIYNEGEGPKCSVPALGKDTTLIGGTAVLDANITLQSGETIAWFKDGITIWNATGTTYTATQVGTYKAVVTGTVIGITCTNEDEIIISAEVIVCSTPDLGSDKSFPGGSVVLDANITLKSGETITWYKDGITIWGINTTTYTATAIGTYKAVTTRPGCTEEDEVIVALTTCSTPDLGKDASLCVGTTITLDASIVLATGESLKWYKDNIEISGATATSYSANAIGTYKAEVTTTDNCLRSDEITITDGGSQKLQVAASNSGQFCSLTSPNQVTLTVTGGSGTYNFFDVPTGGSPISTGASLIVDNNLVSEGVTKTFYVEEESSDTVTVGATVGYSESVWTDFTTNQGWNDHRMVFNTFKDVTLESIDFVFGYKATGPYTIKVTIYEYGTNNVVVTKQVVLIGSSISTSTWAPYPLNTAQLGIDLPAGNYEMSFIGSSFVIQVTNKGASIDVGYNNPSYSAAGIAEIIGANQPFQTGTYPTVIQNVHVGAYNWIFSAGGAGACGRASADVTANCGTTTDVNEVTKDEITVYPNPANDVLYIDLKDINSENSSIELYSAVGQLVMSRNVNSASGNITQFETASIDAGLYLIKVLTGGKVYATTVVITK